MAEESNNNNNNNNRARKRLLHPSSTDSDRLSYLPDSVIHHILSFLDTKFVVQTSVLSRLWRSVWKNVPVLNFDRRSFQDYHNFRWYVDGVLSFRSRFTLDEIVYIDNVDSGKKGEASFLPLKVIQYGFYHGVKRLALDLEFDATMADCYTFSELFGSKSKDRSFDLDLKSLRLLGIALDVGFESFGFQTLTDLELIGCNLLSGNHEVYNPFAGFPCLKNLVLDTCHNGIGKDQFKRFRVSGLELLRVRLVCVERCEIEIFAPKLESLTLWKFEEVEEFSEMTLPSLQHVDIWITRTECDLVANGNEFFASLFKSFGSVKCMTLRYGTTEALGRISEFLEQQPSPFTRLENLNLELESDEVPRTVVSYFVNGSADSRIKVLKESGGIQFSVPIEIH